MTRDRTARTTRPPPLSNTIDNNLNKDIKDPDKGNKDIDNKDNLQ